MHTRYMQGMYMILILGGFQLTKFINGMSNSVGIEFLLIG